MSDKKVRSKWFSCSNNANIECKLSTWWKFGFVALLLSHQIFSNLSFLQVSVLSKRWTIIVSLSQEGFASGEILVSFILITAWKNFKVLILDILQFFGFNFQWQVFCFNSLSSSDCWPQNWAFTDWVNGLFGLVIYLSTIWANLLSVVKCRSRDWPKHKGPLFLLKLETNART